MNLRDRISETLAIHQVEWIAPVSSVDPPNGFFACGCDERGDLPAMDFQSDALNHQADEVLNTVAAYAAPDSVRSRLNEIRVWMTENSRGDVNALAPLEHMRWLLEQMDSRCADGYRDGHVKGFEEGLSAALGQTVNRDV